MKIIIFLLLYTPLSTPSVEAQPRLDTDEIESLIDEWNFANNTRNIHSFERVYADRLTYYGERVSRNQAINLKQQLFRTKPSFRQRIITEVTYTPYTGGVVRCDFTREVFEGNAWRRLPSYLLVSYENHRYGIVAENDVATEKALKRKEDIGEPMILDNRSPSGALADTVDSATSQTVHALPPMEHPDSVSDDNGAIPGMNAFAERDSATADNSQLTFADLDALFSDVTSLGMVTIPKGYLFILIGLLGLGGVMIFVADSIQSSRRRRQARVFAEHAEAAHVVRDFRVQSAFEAFVLTLFDPLFFKSFRPKAEYVYAGKAIQAEQGPDMIFDYKQKENHLRFGITCQYYQHGSKNEIQLLSSQRQDLIRQFESERGMDVYYVLGFGGKPDDPKELFFVPAKEVRSEYMTRGQLLQYSKSGMFYYNRRTGRIQ